MIWDRLVNRVHVLDFTRLIDGMRQTLGDSERVILNKGDLRDYCVEISSNRDFLGLAPSYAHIKDPYLFHYAKGRKSGARLSGGHFIGHLAQHLCEAPQPPPPTPQPRTMSQRIDRLEEEVREMRQSIVALRGVVESSIIEQTIVSTWMISCMTHLMDVSGQTYQAFDGTLVGSS
nr:hypothetical protein [Tanacetum cinerariifolium]